MSCKRMTTASTTAAEVRSWAGRGLFSLAALLLGALPAAAQTLWRGGSVRKVPDRFVSGDRPITAWRFEPKGPGPFPAVLLLHGTDGPEANAQVYHAVAGRLAGRGYVVFVVHYFERTGTRGPGRAKLGERLKAHLAGKGAAEDAGECERHFREWMAAVADAVAHARKRPNVDGTRVGLVGCSLGSYLALAVAAHQGSDVAAVVELFGGLPRPLHAGLRRLPPVLIVHGDADRVVPVGEAHALRDLLTAHGLPFEQRLYPGVGHMFLDDEGGLQWGPALDAEARAAAFLDRHLGRTTATTTASAAAGR